MMHSSSKEDTNTAQHRAEQARHILRTLTETKPKKWRCASETVRLVLVDCYTAVSYFTVCLMWSIRITYGSVTAQVLTLSSTEDVIHTSAVLPKYMQKMWTSRNGCYMTVKAAGQDCVYEIGLSGAPVGGQLPASITTGLIMMNNTAVGRLKPAINKD